MALPVRLGVVRALLKEISLSSGNPKPLVVGGARELAAVLRRELGSGAASGAVRGSDDPEGAAVLVYVLGREPAADDEAALKRAHRARVPIVAVAAGPVSDDLSIPFVLATDVVRVGAGEGFPIDAIARAVAARLGEDGAPLAGRLPVLRGAVAEQLIRTFSQKSGIVGAAVFVPGADLPVIALHQLRLVLRLSQVHGLDPDPRERSPELVATLCAALGLRALARQLLDLVPFAGWAIKGAVAYAGTRALGEATLKRVEMVAPRGHAPD